MRDHHTSQHLHVSTETKDSLGAAPVGDMFQCKTYEKFKISLNVFGIGDDILVVGYDTDGKDHDEML